MNKKQWVLASLAVVAVMWVVETIIHGFMLSRIYQETATVWRPMEAMQGMMPLMWLGYFLFAPFFVYIYAKGYEPNEQPLDQGLRFGLVFGIGLAAMHSLGWYAVLPIPPALAFQWFLAGVTVYAVAGIAAAYVYRPSTRSARAGKKTKVRRRG